MSEYPLDKRLRVALDGPLDPDRLLAGPTMSRDECRCPDDCDCEGRFACEVPAGDTEARCELVVGHDGWHRSGGHRWDRSQDPA